MKYPKSVAEQAMDFVRLVARMSQDGECSNCGGVIDVADECTCDPEDSSPFEMTAEDAAETLESLIRQAREIQKRDSGVTL